MNHYVKLGVNIDHVATLRNARGGQDPVLLQMALAVEEAGADGITIHLREDRRHIRDDDVWLLRSHLRTPMNLEMAATDEMDRDAVFKKSHRKKRRQKTDSTEGFQWFASWPSFKSIIFGSHYMQNHHTTIRFGQIARVDRGIC